MESGGCRSIKFDMNTNNKITMCAMYSQTLKRCL